MKNAKKQFKEALNNTIGFMLSIEENSSERIPDWFDNIALFASHKNLANPIYESLFLRLQSYLQREYGSKATKFILS